MRPARFEQIDSGGGQRYTLYIARRYRGGA
jgi:hypothetical protein